MALDRRTVLELIENNDGPKGLDLSGLDLSGIDLSGIDLHGVNMARANLTGADLRWSNLRDADLRWAVLERVDLRWADLYQARLQKADLRQADLWWAEFAEADIGEADLTAADLDQPTLRGAVGQPIGIGRTGRPTTSRADVPSIGRSNASMAALVGGFAGLVYFWGLMYRVSYFRAFGLPSLSVLGLASADYLAMGWRVLAASAGFLLMLPLLVLYALLVVGLLLLIPFGFIFLGDRLLSTWADDRVRWAIILSLFLGYLFSFQYLFPRISPLWGWLLTHGIPLETGIRVLRDGVDFSRPFQDLLLLALLVVSLAPLWVIYELLTQVLHRIDPADYPRFAEGIGWLRDQPPFARARTVTVRDRRWAALATVLLVLAIPTFLTQVGEIHAAAAMCDAQSFPQISLTAEKQLDIDAFPKAKTEGVPEGSLRYDCLRLLLFDQDKYYVFYPHQTELVDGRREPIVYEIPVEDVVQATHRRIPSCPGCDAEVTGEVTPVITATVTATLTPVSTVGPIATTTSTSVPPPSATVTSPPEVTPPTATSTPSATATTSRADAFEPDELDPPPIAPGETQTRSFYPEGDTDWVIFHVESDRTYVLRAHDVGARVDSRLRVEIGGEVFESDPNFRDPAEVSFEAPVTGLALAEIRNASPFGFSPPENVYNLTLQEDPPPATPTPTGTETPTRTATPSRTATPTLGKDTFESNNSFSQAFGPLAPGAVYKSFIWAAADQDYYRFNVTVLSNPITVELFDIPGEVDYDLFLYDTDRDELARAEGTDDEEKITYAPPVTGTYYVLIFTPNSTFDRENPYSLRVKFAVATPTPTDTPTPVPPTATATPRRVLRPSTPTSTPMQTNTTTPTNTLTETPTPEPTATASATP